MPALTPLIRAISLDATASLVALGLVATNVAITAATNASPIVVTTATPHLIIGSTTGTTPRASVVIAGVLGNTNANGTYIAHVVDATHLSLYAYDTSAANPPGTEIPVAGNGAYAGGGTVQTAFTEGEIVVGRIRTTETFAPPHCVFVPKGFRFAPRSTANRNAVTTGASAQGSSVRSYSMTQYGSGYSATPTVVVSAPDISGGVQAAATAVVSSTGALTRLVPTVGGSGYLNPPTVTITDPTGSQATATANLGPTPEALAQMAQRSVLTEWDQFEVQVWGVNSPRDYDLDFDATQAVYQQIIASIHRLAAGVYNMLPGIWADSRPNAPQMSVFGHMAVFGVELATPVLDVARGFAPVGVRPQATLQIVQPSTGQTEVGFSGTL